LENKVMFLHHFSTDESCTTKRQPTTRAPDRLWRRYAGAIRTASCYYGCVALSTPAAGTPYGKTTLRGRKQTQTVGQPIYLATMKSADFSPLTRSEDQVGLTWNEHNRLFRRLLFSWRVFGLAFLISILLAFTLGVVFQTVFLFTVFQGFLILAKISQPFYSDLVFIANDHTLPRKLPKPPITAILASVIPLLISCAFLYFGYLAYQETGFCAQSLGCIFIRLIQSI
jgi:hypothetical protein